ncbi:MAG: hypothetical protein GC155_13750 [Alphaproteobacteria bacterium]|nr:hypothetical protein [Alphaproteobacteria bacterium]
MTEEISDRRATHRIRARLEAARSAGSWMPWTGASLALLYWAGTAAWLYVTMGVDAIMAQPPVLLVGAIAVMLVPGVALIVAGVMAQESRRSSEANAIVLASARLLLEPADYARDEIASIAEAVARETQQVNKALSDTRGRMDGLKHDIEASVTQALKAAEIVRTDSEVLVQKMSSERQSLNQLSESLRNQADGLARAIPRYAQTMSDAARLAQAEVQKADETLDQRLRSVEDAARRLGERIDQLDTMGAESRKRAQNLAGALARMDEQLVQSTRMVDAAVRAGELATAAAKGTADSLRDAMSDALNSALKTSETIAAQSSAASDGAEAALLKLKEMGLQAEASTRSATHAARAHADETEQRINQLSEFLFRAASKASQMTEGGLEKARERIEHASLLVRQIKGEDAADTSVEDLWLGAGGGASDRPEPPRAETLRSGPGKPTASAEFETAMREAGAPETIIAAHQASMSRPASALHAGGQPAAAPSAPSPAPAAPPQQPSPQAAAPAAPATEAEAPRSPSLSWRDLLTGIEEVGPAEREETALNMIDQLSRAGVKLNHIVRASDLRRIASASHQGERQRRRAIRDVAPSEIQRVSRLLDADRALQKAARTFVAVEEPDALRVIAGAERAREDAAPRLSAYLLLDAALGTMI